MALLSSASSAQFAATGWLLLDGLLDVPVSELDRAVTSIASTDGHGVLQHVEMTDAGPRLARSENFTPSNELLARILRHGDVAAVAGELLGEPAVLYKEKINYKAPGGAGFSPHQDKPAYPFVDRVLSVMIAVDDSTIANGCLYVASGSHSELLDQDERGCVAGDVVERLEWQPVELRAGETLFFDALLPHRSGPNTSHDERRAIFPTYNGASEGDLREAYYAEKLRLLAEQPDDGRVALSLIGDFEGRPA